MQALEVGEARVIAGVDQRVEAGLDQLGGAAAEHRLLAEEVGLALVLEGGLDHAGAGAADALGVGEHHLLGVAGRVLVDGEQAGNAAAGLELAADEVARTLRGDHADVDAGRRLDLAEVDREAVGEHQQVALGDPVLDLGLPDVGLALVGKQDHHHVAGAGGVGDVHHLESVLLGLGARARVGAQADDDVDPRVLEVERVRVALGAVAQDRDGLPLEVGEVGVVLVKYRIVCCHRAAEASAARFAEPSGRN